MLPIKNRLQSSATMMESMTPMAAAAAGLPVQRSCSVRGVYLAEPRQVCICLRERCTVFCHCCGYVTLGRLHMECIQHPNVSFLFDIHECANCHVKNNMMEEVRVE